MAEDAIKPVEKRRHAATGRRPTGRPRKTAIRKPDVPEGVENVPEQPGLIDVPPVVKSEVQQVTDDLTTLYGTLGTFVMFANQYDGFVILQNSENMAKSVVAVCHQYESAWRVLKLVTQGNVWSVLVLAHLGPALAIMSNHGMVSNKVAGAFNQATPPAREVPSMASEAPGPYTYPGGQAPQAQPQEQQMTPELMQALVEAMAQQGQMTPQQEQALYAPPPVDYGNAGAGNGAVGMDSAGGLGDQDAAMQRALFSAQQINAIREESIRKTQEMRQSGKSNGL